MDAKQKYTSDSNDMLPFGFGINLDSNENVMNKFTNNLEDANQRDDFEMRKQHTQNDIEDYIIRLGEQDQTGMSPN